MDLIILHRVLSAPAITAAPSARRLGETRQSTGVQGRRCGGRCQVFLESTFSQLYRTGPSRKHIACRFPQLSKFRSDILPCDVVASEFRGPLGARMGCLVTVQVISSDGFPFPPPPTPECRAGIMGDASTCRPCLSDSTSHATEESIDASLLFAIRGAMLGSLGRNGAEESLWCEVRLRAPDLDPS